MALQALTLDAGGTLLSERFSRSRIYAEAAWSRGLDVSEATMAQWMHRTHELLPLERNGLFRYSDGWFEQFIECIFCNGLRMDSALLPGLRDELFARFAAPSTFQLLPGAHDLLAELCARGVRVGIVSNWSPHLEPVLLGLGVRDLLTGVWVSAIERVEKPSAMIFQRACRGLNVEPAAALHAGDHPINDFQGARAAGLQAILVDSTGRHAEHEGPRVRDLVELLHHVRSPRHDRT